MAFLILDENGLVLKTSSRFLGERTNNQAEYEALIAALEAAKSMGGGEVTCHLDSEVVAKHLRGEYRLRNVELRSLWLRVQELKTFFGKVSFVHVPRTNRCIQEADALVNEALDKATG